MKVLGLVGFGIVGKAFYEGMKEHFIVQVYDSDPKKTGVKELRELLDHKPEAIFVCVPTPMKSDGSCSLAIIESVLHEINQYSANTVVVIKSTVAPGSTLEFQKKYQNIKLAFNPEFLTEASPIEDFKNQDRIIVGSTNSDISQLIVDIYTEAYPSVTKIQMSSTAAEMVKYVANCFLATKVSFANEMYQICSKLDVDYENIIRTAMLDKRLGSSHWKVPGPDGKYGWGLSCFPKDLNALIYLAEKLGVDPLVMKAVWAKNIEVRPEKDWEALKGRAVC